MTRLLAECPPAIRGSARAAFRIAIRYSLLVSTLNCCGCYKVAAAWANISHGDWIEAEFTLSKAPLLVLVDDRNSLVTEPAAARELHKTIAANFLEFKVNHNLVPYEDWQRLVQSDKKYNKYSV